MIVMDGGRISHCGRPRKVLPLVEKQLLSIKKTVVEEEVGGAKGGASNKTDNQAQVHVHARVYNIMHRLYTNAINIYITRSRLYVYNVMYVYSNFMTNNMLFSGKGHQSLFLITALPVCKTCISVV